MKYIGLFGGSFNPVHVGHIRLAIEVLEYQALPLVMERVELIPCATPPHKEPKGLLPFDLRYAMLKASCQNIAGLDVSAIENERAGYSYTWHTLESYKQRFPQHRLLFMIGIENLCDLPHWHRGLELPRLADIGVVPRAGGEQKLFAQKILEHWPHASLSQGKYPVASLEEQWQDSLCGAQPQVFYMPLPRIDISASYIRERWLHGGSLYGLMPEAALHILENSQEQAQLTWK